MHQPGKWWVGLLPIAALWVLANGVRTESVEADVASRAQAVLAEAPDIAGEMKQRLWAVTSGSRGWNSLTATAPAWARRWTVPTACGWSIGVCSGFCRQGRLSLPPPGWEMSSG